MRTATIHRHRTAKAGAAVTIAGAGLLVLAACGSGGNAGGAYGSGGSSGGAAAASGSSGSGTTVTVHDAGGMKVLATSSGRTLYSSAQENGMALCKSGACQAIWIPLTVSAGQKPTASAGVAKHLGTIKEANGAHQVTFDGRPLYTFSFDHSAGQLNGNGQHDSFDGTSFSWHAATPTGAVSTMPSSSSSGAGNSSGSSHGYSY